MKKIFHELSESLPLMSEGEILELGGDINKNEFLESLTIYEGKIS